jgi:hypothetical protein
MVVVVHRTADVRVVLAFFGQDARHGHKRKEKHHEKDLRTHLRPLRPPRGLLREIALFHDPQEKIATLPAKIQPLFTSWKLDTNASSKMNTDAVKDSTGIKADIKLSGDVGKLADFAAKTLFITFDKDTMKTAYQETYGEGLLSSSSAGWLTIDNDATTMTLTDAKGKETIYTIKEVAADKLVLQLKSSGVYEVFNKK